MDATVDEPSRHVRARATTTLLAALAAGCATQALLWGAHIGVGWLVLDVAMVAGTMLALRRVNVAGAVLGAAAIALGGAVAFYGSDWALVVAWPIDVLLLGVLPFVVARDMRLGDLGSIAGALVDGVVSIPRSVVASARLPSEATGGSGRAHAARFLLGAALGIPITTLFAFLFAADPSFARAAGAVADRSVTALRFALYSALTAAAYVIGYVLHARSRSRRDERALEASEKSPTALPVPYRQVGDREAPGAMERGPLVRPLTWGAVLAQLVAVFALFVAVNVRTLFGGHALVTALGTPTYAGYLHAGFLQLSLATLLSVVTVVIGHRLMRDRGATLRVSGGAVIQFLEATLLVLTAISLASCAQRLRIYEEAYGFTYQRLAVGFAQLGALLLLALTLGKSIAREWRGYGAAVVILGIGMAVYVGTYDADLRIARSNVARANDGRPLDLDYLATLSADALPVLSDPMIANDAQASTMLGDAWRTSARRARSGGWRSWRGLGATVFLPVPRR